MIGFPIIETEGTPYEMGFQHGRKARKQIQACLDQCIPSRGGTDEDRQRAAMIERTVTERMPEALEEMRGIAEGAHLPYEDILLLNLSIELWRIFMMPRNSCTIIGMAGKEPLLAKTIDSASKDDHCYVCQRARPSSGYDFLHLTYAGTLWTDGGVNTAGLAQVNASLESNTDNWSGFPVWIMARYLLQSCATVSQAIEAAQRYDAINTGGNFLLGDSSGDFAVIEKTIAQAVRRLEAEPKVAGQVGEVIFATNHSVTAEMEPFLGGTETVLMNSQQRFENLARLAQDVKRDLEGAISLLRDHALPGGLCQHGQDGLYTTAAFVAFPKQARLWVARRYPCQSEFRPVTL